MVVLVDNVRRKGRIVLLGIKHSGKSTIGQGIADLYGYPFYDTDEVILKLSGASPRDIYNSGGQEALLEHEASACQYIWGLEPLMVVATGGGICDNKKALNIIDKDSILVYLKVPEGIARDRILAEANIDNGGRLVDMVGLPAYIAKSQPETVDDVRAIFGAYYRRRTALYEKIARVCVSVDLSTPKENILMVQGAIESYKG